jgi:hypothetical protein
MVEQLNSIELARNHIRMIIIPQTLKQRLRELSGVEGLQIVRLLAEADEFDGQAEFLLDRHHHAAFARAVELGHGDFTR